MCNLLSDSTRFDLGSMDKTRSGRTVKKPLAWWAGERVKFNFSTDSVEIASCTNDSLNNTTIIDPDKVRKMRDTNNTRAGADSGFL